MGFMAHSDLDPFIAASLGADKSDRSPPLSEVAFRVLRQQILNGDIPPGEKLRMETLQREHSLSSSPLREALNRLVAEKLVIADDHRGFRAAPMSSADLNDITGFRLIIEPAALSLSIKNGNDEWEGRVVAALHRLERVRERISRDEISFNAEWTGRHKDFHTALISAAGAPRLLDACSNLFDQAERYRRFSAMNRTQPRDTGSEHRQLMETALARQVELAVALVREHISRTTQSTLALRKERGQD
jgi:GntR family transcriptional regulator, carbon starvation induced regulator